MVEDIDTKRTPVWSWLLLGFIVVILLWGGSLWWIARSSSHQDSANIGDSFGAINALFSGLAFAGVLVAILLQKKELELQREELGETRRQTQRLADESTRQSKEFKLHTKHLQSQQVDRQYFSLLDVARQARIDIYVRLRQTTWRGADAAHAMLDQIKMTASKLTLTNENIASEIAKRDDATNELMDWLYTDTDLNIKRYEQYFQSLTNILIYLERRSVEKSSYLVDVVRTFPR